MPFEKIVRPYQLPGVTPTAIEFSAGATETDAPIRLRPGLIGKTKTFNGSAEVSTTAYAIRKPKEKSGN